MGPASSAAENFERYCSLPSKTKTSLVSWLATNTFASAKTIPRGPFSPAAVKLRWNAPPAS